MEEIVSLSTFLPKPAQLLREHFHLLEECRPGPVLDVACGDGRNGLFLAAHGFDVVCCDNSVEALRTARMYAARSGLKLALWHVDLEAESLELPEEKYGVILVFRFLHRPLMNRLRRVLRPGGILVYETFTKEQQRFGSPSNPDYLLEPGELESYFADWEIVHSFEGFVAETPGEVAQLVCRKPASRSVV